MTITLAVDSDDDDGDGPEGAEPSDEPTIELRFSVAEVLRHKDFAAYDDAELAEAHRVMHRMRLTGSPRRSLRLAPTTRRTNRPDLRRTVRAALRTEGEAAAPALPARRRRGTAGSCCCSTSAARWSRTPGRCCASSRPRWPGGGGSRRSPSAPG